LKAHQVSVDFRTGRGVDAKSLAAEIAQNRRYLRALDPSIKVENFAYPFGYGSFGYPLLKVAAADSAFTPLRNSFEKLP